MDRTQLSSHGHPARVLESRREGTNCNVCLSPKPARYQCCKCFVYMCENCFKLPREIFHWLHPQHPLVMHNMDEERGICEGCNYIFWSQITYECEVCRFSLCVECCTSRISRRPLQWENKKFFHYSHVHELKRCRFWEEDKSRCTVCELRMWGVGYACARCLHFVHESCINTPHSIQYPFHPSHPLKRLDFPIFDYTKKCKLCKDYFLRMDFREGPYPFGCTECNYYLHFRCADSLFRPIKLECHIHNLFYFPARITQGYIQCRICSLSGDKWRASYFRCVQCDEAFHFNCVPIPQSLKHKDHQHTLVLKEPFHQYTLEEHYCYICEAGRNPKNNVYCCEQCKFFGHIECVLSKEDSIPKFLSSLWSRKLKKDEPATHPDSSTQKQIQYACHDHPLRLENFTNKLCRLCKLEINGPGFKCERCLDTFRVHEKCATLPENLDHPLHPNHKLSLFKHYPESSWEGEFICDICRDISKGFNFFCRTCGFVIDIKCVFRNKVAQSFDDKSLEKTLKHPVHRHELKLANATNIAMDCNICEEDALGLIYYCNLRYCGDRFHPTCLDWPAVVEQHPLHPQHRLKLKYISYSEPQCFACGLEIRILGYECEKFSLKCTVAFHLECANSLARLLKHSDHHLYYFHKQPSKGLSEMFSDDPKDKKCSLCHGETKSFYYICMECKLHFHLRCLRLPHTTKHKYHLHQLTFEDSIDFGVYYCDICEKPRDFQHPVYCCKECELVACINCIVSEENAASVTQEEIENNEVKISTCGSGSAELSD